MKPEIKAVIRSMPALLTLVLIAGASYAEPSRVGKPVEPTELAKLNFTVLPDGSGAPAGSGTAIEGEAVYARHCQVCHGAGGSGGINDALVGGEGSLVTTAPKKTVGSFWPYATTLLDYINRSMPYNAPGTLSNDELYAVTAYILQQNKIIDANKRLSAATLAQINMPNRDGFNWLPTNSKTER